MDIVSVESKIHCLEGLALLATVMTQFCDSKKHMKLIKRMVLLECGSLKKENCLLNEADRNRVIQFCEELKDVSKRLYKIRSVENYNRGKGLLLRFHEEISAELRRSNVVLVEGRGVNAFESVKEHAKKTEDLVQQGIERLKVSLEKKQEEEG